MAESVDTLGARQDVVDLRASEPIGTVLVPTDFSSGADLAFRRALMLPLASDARIHIVHVLPPDVPAQVRDKVTEDAMERLEKLAGQVRESAAGSDVTTDVMSGEPFVEIIRRSRSISADLIVIGRHGRRPFKDLFIGTTAERVVRKGDVPVLVVNLEHDTSYARPMIASDFADASRRTFELALRVVGPDVKDIDVVHAFNVPFENFVAPVRAPGEESEYRKECRANAQAGLDSFLAPYQALDVNWRQVVRAGDPRSVIVGEALRSRADLVALGTHARSGVSHALVGSVAEWVISSAPCDVLVARPVRFTFELP